VVIATKLGFKLDPLPASRRDWTTGRCISKRLPTLEELGIGLVPYSP
jgi:hypothetical protein